MDGQPPPFYDGGIDRLRSGQACLTCRKRKNKCDGSRPACGFCNRRSLRCVYDDAIKNAGVDRGYVETLEQKVRRLEQELRQRGTESSFESPPMRPQTDESLIQDFRWRNPQARPRATRVEKLQPVPSDASNTLLEKDHDLVKIIKYGEISIHSALADFGVAPSGTSPSEVTQTVSTEVPEHDFSSRDADVDIREEHQPMDDNCFVLPPRSLALRLADLFFDHVAPLLPLVHEPSFRKELEALYEGHQSASIAFRSIINVVFAYGCDYLDLELKRTYELAQEFHERATDLILLVCYELASLEVVQALLLVTLHLNSSMQFHRMWVNTGLLVRTAQALNLHLDPSEWKINMIEKELRKRFWWSIYSLDRFISLKHCRPPALNIEAGHSARPAAVDDDLILPHGIAESQDPRRPPSQLHFFNHLMQLIHISETALSSSSTNAPWKPSKRQTDSKSIKTDATAVIYTQLSAALEQESKLAGWLEELPQHLQFDYINSSPKLRKQQKSLQARYLHTRLLIHRPNMISALKLDNNQDYLGGSDGFLQSILTASIQQCIQCSCELVGLVQDHYQQNSIGPWWLLLQFIFTTLATLFAVQGRRSLVPTPGENDIMLAIEKGMALLRSFGDIDLTLIQCRQYFELIMPVTMAYGTLTDVANTSRHRLPDRLPENSQGQPSYLPHLMNGFQNMQQQQQRSFPRFEGLNDFYIPDLGPHNVDQTMTDSTAELFPNRAFGGFNFGALDPFLQM